ncbi:MAG: hypothetical protein AMJ53_14225 [Gammaproteobacteria bacterium SG8_11]|nr:MAG: hypothetical protein AMJ53_14225 [Gammaproteobacteria bacterium SG8_11]
MEKQFIKIFTLMIALLSVFVVAPASAVTFAGQFTEDKFNNIGTDTRVLFPTLTHFCALTRVGVRETDTGAEQARCTVRPSGAVWILEATLGATSDQDVFCMASCFTRF